MQKLTKLLQNFYKQFKTIPTEYSLIGVSVILFVTASLLFVTKNNPTKYTAIEPTPQVAGAEYAEDAAVEPEATATDAAQLEETQTGTTP